MLFRTDPTLEDPHKDARIDAELAAIESKELLEQLTSDYLDKVHDLTERHDAFREAGFFNYRFDKGHRIVWTRTSKADAVECVLETVEQFLRKEEIE